jgi:hypothetical protein
LHELGGGNVKVLNERLSWEKKSKTEHVAKGYKPQGFLL